MIYHHHDDDTVVDLVVDDSLVRVFDLDGGMV
jgi:hypothetical protein